MDLICLSMLAPKLLGLGAALVMLSLVGRPAWGHLTHQLDLALLVRKYLGL